MNYIDKIAEVDNYLKNNISSKRYTHSLEVAKMSARIAKKFNLDHYKTYLSGLSHDIARELPMEYQLEIIGRISGLSTDFLKVRSIYHGPVGSFILEDRFNVSDIDILEGVKYHSVGSCSISELGKCVFVADYISEDRVHISKDFREKILNLDLDEMVYYVLLEMKKYLISQGKRMTRESIELFNRVNR